MTEGGTGSLPAAVTKAYDMLLLAHQPCGQVSAVASVCTRGSDRIARVSGIRSP